MTMFQGVLTVFVAVIVLAIVTAMFVLLSKLGDFFVLLAGLCAFATIFEIFNFLCLIFSGVDYEEKPANFYLYVLYFQPELLVLTVRNLLGALIFGMAFGCVCVWKVWDVFVGDDLVEKRAKELTKPFEHQLQEEQRLKKGLEAEKKRLQEEIRAVRWSEEQINRINRELEGKQKLYDVVLEKCRKRYAHALGHIGRMRVNVETLRIAVRRGLITKEVLAELKDEAKQKVFPRKPVSQAGATGFSQ